MPREALVFGKVIPGERFVVFVPEALLFELRGGFRMLRG